MNQRRSIVYNLTITTDISALPITAFAQMQLVLIVLLLLHDLTYRHAL